MDCEITVIIPCYNFEKYISDCIESLLKQTNTTWKAIIIDDCSKDNTIQIIKPYIEKFDNISLITNESNLGAYPTLNKAIESVDTPFYTRLDGDDLIEPTYLDRCLELMKNDSDLGAVFVNFKTWDSKQNYSSKDYPEIVKNTTFSLTNIFEEYSLKRSNGYFYPSISEYFRGIGLIRRSIQNKIGKFESWKSEADIFMWLKICYLSKAHVINEPLYIYRHVSDSVTATVSKNNQDLYWKKKLIEEIALFLKQESKITSEAVDLNLKQLEKEYLKHLIYRNRKNNNYIDLISNLIQLIIR